MKKVVSRPATAYFLTLGFGILLFYVFLASLIVNGDGWGATVLMGVFAVAWAWANNDHYEVDLETIKYKKYLLWLPVHGEMRFDEIEKIVSGRGYQHFFNIESRRTTVYIKVKSSMLLKVVHLPLFENHDQLLRAILQGMRNANRVDRVEATLLL